MFIKDYEVLCIGGGLQPERFVLKQLSGSPPKAEYL